MSGSVAISNDTDRASQAPDLGTGALVRRMLALSWRYRWGCLRLLALQGMLLWTALAALDLSGVGIDAVLFHARAAKRPAIYPFGFTLPNGWSPLAEVAAIAIAILLLAGPELHLRRRFGKAHSRTHRRRLAIAGL
jgi:hypothetical protein